MIRKNGENCQFIKNTILRFLKYNYLNDKEKLLKLLIYKKYNFNIP